VIRDEDGHPSPDAFDDHHQTPADPDAHCALWVAATDPLLLA